MRILAPLLALVLLAAACGGDDGDGPTAASEPTAAAETAATADAEPTATPAPEPTAPTQADPATEELFPDVVAAEASLDGDGTWTFRTTLSSPYDTPQRYADAWRVLDPDGNELGVRILTHDHANEQPFTRSLSNVEIPDDVSVVTIEGRDQISGWGGATVDVQLQR